MSTIHCPYCGSENVEFIGITDGGGAYGDMLCETWFCPNCAEDFEGVCEDEFYDEGDDYEPDELDEPDDDADSLIYGDIPF